MKLKSLRWSDDFMYQTILNHDKSYDGKFLTCVKSTGIYCLPSCPARKPLLKNIRFLSTQQEAVAAGFRICKRCRPDLFYRGEHPDRHLFSEMLIRIRSRPDEIKNVTILAKVCGISTTKLNELVRIHAHRSPAELLSRERITAACQRLINTNERVLDIGLSVGFDSEASFHRQFLSQTAMTPNAYRLLRESSGFTLKLPADFSAPDIWRYHLRDRDSLSERLENQTFSKGLWVEGKPVLIHLTIDDNGAHCRWETSASQRLENRLTEGEIIHQQVMRLLGLNTDISGFRGLAKSNNHIAKLLAVSEPKNIYVPLTATPFEALTWAIIGQQINLTFAATLRQALIKLAGPEIPGSSLKMHPTPVEIAQLAPQQLSDIRFSRAKSEYLITAAKAIMSGELNFDELESGSAVVAEEKLCKLKGIGPWTARYTLMRGMGFADCVPVGDSGLHTALQQFYQLDARPTAAEAERLMQPFIPFRTLATAYLWESLRKKHETEN
ncbi:DNA-3-methyladenine glycosylase 2 family protein [Budvicia diplopodorum]|uniref:DNA-3-methyladenine glycosylase 2 family protein n=1 Tax=Budvicia diplopodorum TaxID=1119056 RepID=UPI001359BEC5|nr:Ada metal-binding domain-containing protein [Budvicia diplopodorum]